MTPYATLRTARVLNPNSDSNPHPYNLRCLVGDVIAVTAVIDIDDKPTLGLLLDEQHLLQNSKQYDVYGHTLYRIPTPKERPGLRFLNAHTPFLFLGTPDQDTLNCVKDLP